MSQKAFRYSLATVLLVGTILQTVLRLFPGVTHFSATLRLVVASVVLAAMILLIFSVALQMVGSRRDRLR